MLLPILTGELYYFPPRQLIFSFGRHVLYHLRVHSEIDSVCLCPSVPRSSNQWLDFVFILNLWCTEKREYWSKCNVLFISYKLIKIQSNWKLPSNFTVSFELTTIFWNNSGIGFMRVRRGEAFFADHHAF